tara:strand:- start:576 stop:1403 length:828 start_codon:yes stop_codon:yes gene_type:complete
MNKIVIQLICPDQQGIIAQITSILYKCKINILSIEQHVDDNEKKFYIRILADLKNSNINFNQLDEKISTLNNKLNGKLTFRDPNKKANVAILGTKESEPIYDLLIKKKAGDLNCNIPVIISNHNNLEIISKQFNIEYFKTNNNDKILQIFKKNKIDLIILARYMQIIPDDIIKHYKNKIINIHHGFLPAFKGANPYRQAYEKGVKIIGATAHYVTKELDEGPILYQDVVNINHKHSVDEMIQIGRGVERNVLYEAVKAHLNHKVIVFNNKTIVFN